MYHIIYIAKSKLYTLRTSKNRPIKKMENITQLPEWQMLVQHQQETGNQHMRDLFAADKMRFNRFSLSCGEIFLDYSRNRINECTISLLSALAHAVGLSDKIENLFNGQPINATEKRPALHTALRDQTACPITVKGIDVKTLIAKMREDLAKFVSQITNKTWKGVTGKPIQHIVNVGIGGSHLGPMMCTQALKDYAHSDLQFHFISSVDKTGLLEVLQQIDPETSLFIVSSKTFSTIETLTNARTIAAWMKEKLGENAIKQHFVAITSAKQKALEFGIPEKQIFPLWDWVGGRYSVWSAIGLPLMLMIGIKQFNEFLAGAFAMDEHFRKQDFTKNMPVLLALLGVWYMNFYGTRVQAIIPYAHRLRYLIAYLQQAEMESNGKTTKLNGNQVEYATGPVIFGEEGCNGQHAYHQLLLQGQHLIPVDFILIGKAVACANDVHQDILIASGLSQAQALMRGKSYKEARAELIALNYPEEEANYLAYHRAIPGNRPSNIIFLERLTPKNLGSLLALYEHKIFVQGAIWGINSFDQWGVELGKELLPNILRSVQGDLKEIHADPATAGMIGQFKKNQTEP